MVALFFHKIVRNSRGVVASIACCYFPSEVVPEWLKQCPSHQGGSPNRSDKLVFFPHDGGWLKRDQHFHFKLPKVPLKKYRKKHVRLKGCFFPTKMMTCLEKHCSASKGVMIWSPLGRDGSSHCCATSAHPKIHPKKELIKITSSHTSFGNLANLKCFFGRL